MGSTTRMSSSFLLVPAASADSVAELRATIQRMGKIPEGEPAARLKAPSNHSIRLSNANCDGLCPKPVG